MTTWGESHGPGIGVVIDGLPAGVPIAVDEIAAELVRRRPGGALASPRKEPDVPKVQSGLYEGRTLGTPLAIWIESVDARPRDYDALAKLYRPGHADYTTLARYGFRDPRGGGRASARETAARVAAGSVALQLLRQSHNVEIVAWVDRVGAVEATVDVASVTREAVESSPVRCPDPAASAAMVKLIEEVRDAGDSLGGWVRVVARGVPPGWGDPVFGKLKAWLGNAFFTLPAVQAVEIGDGIAATGRRGSENNDPFAVGDDGRVMVTQNYSGGIQGGISNGAPIRASVGFKPTSTIRTKQATVDESGQPVEFEGTGRHDPCVLPRAVPLVEAMLAFVLADRMLSYRATPPALAEDLEPEQGKGGD